MPNQAKTHEDNRKTVCFLCMNKANRQLTDFMIKRSQEILGQRINFEDQRVPIGICENCRVSLRRKGLFFHVTQFIDRHNHSLGIFSKQATESLHHNFSLHWQRFKRPAIHPDYPRNLRKCLIEYNSKHLF